MGRKIDHIESGRLYTTAMILLVISSVLVLSGCHGHLPPPRTANTQDTIVKRQLDSEGGYYVRAGDTLYAIAFSYGVDAMEVARLNGISSPFTIYPGQKIKLPIPAANSQDSNDSSAVQITTIRTPGQVTTKTIQNPNPSTTAESAPARSTTVQTPDGTTKPVVTAPPPSGSTAEANEWTWPTNGRVIRGFVVDDPARNGLDIAGIEGQEVSASSTGQVVYSGSGLIGYGELIIIKHSEQLLSAYAHNRVRLVKEGDQVWVGQKIAEMGRNSRDEQILHFEIRVLGKPVNPLIYLPKK